MHTASAAEIKAGHIAAGVSSALEFAVTVHVSPSVSSASSSVTTTRSLCSAVYTSDSDDVKVTVTVSGCVLAPRQEVLCDPVN